MARGVVPAKAAASPILTWRGGEKERCIASGAFRAVLAPRTAHAATAGATHVPPTVTYTPLAGNDPRLVGDDRGLHAVADPELPEDRADVDLHGDLDDVDARGDLGVGQARADQAEHLAFPRGQNLDPLR